VPTPWFG